MHLRGSLVLPLLFSLACGGVSASVAAPPSALGPRAWAMLQHDLPGTWTMPGKSGPFVVTYRLISGGSALVEDWGGAGSPHETETIFHRDHDDVLLTHYCAQGNQPRLRAAELSDDAVVFRFVDVTNRMPDQSMLVERTLRFAQGALDDTEVYRGPDGKDEPTTYHLTRASAGASP